MARRQKYKFAKKEYARQGKISTGIAAVSLFLFFVAVLVSFSFGGQAGMYVGGLGMMIMLLSIFGLIVGIRGFSEKKCSHTFCAIGTVANGLIAVVFVILISLGVA